MATSIENSAVESKAKKKKKKNVSGNMPEKNGSIGRIFFSSSSFRVLFSENRKKILVGEFLTGSFGLPETFFFL